MTLQGETVDRPPTLGARLLVFDRTCERRGLGLSTAWSAGAVLYRGLRRVDAAQGVASWDEALGWLARHDGTIDEIQYWGHGRWGRIFVDRDPFDATSLARTSTRAAHIDAVRERLAPNALLWLRTCEAFGADAGIDFASRLADRFGVRVAGHTFVIGVWQSGLHGLRPGERPSWSATEGLAEGTAESPGRARGSSRQAPHTLTCFDGAVPADWF